MSQPPATSSPPIVTSADEIGRLVGQAHLEGKKLGLVPTMGALHQGHLSLVQRATAECDAVFVTIFVNPTQFCPGEDFDQYPRDLEADRQLLAPLGVSAIFAPSVEEIYPPGSTTCVHPPEVAQSLEGRFRPEHFPGVVTVCLKLFHLLPVDVAYFGQKDYQQSLVIRQMVRDLLLPLEIRVCPTVRDADGLALSSRNAYLDPGQRTRALALSRSLERAAELVQQGERAAGAIHEEMHRVLAEAGVLEIDYIALAHPDSLEEVSTITGPTMALVAAHVDGTRLIDNRRIE